MQSQKLRCVQVLVFVGLSTFLTLVSCGSDGGSSGPDLCAQLEDPTTRCVAIYAVPESASVPVEVDACWGGAHITLAGFYPYEPNNPALENLIQNLNDAATTSPSGTSWHVQTQPRQYWGKAQKTSPPNESQEGTFHLTFPSTTLSTGSAGQPVTGGAKTNYDTLNGVRTVLKDSGFQKIEPTRAQTDHRCLTAENPDDRCLPLHITFNQEDCYEGTSCYEAAANALFEKDPVSSETSTWQLIPVMQPLVNGVCPTNGSCPQIAPQRCTTYGSDPIASQ